MSGIRFAHCKLLFMFNSKWSLKLLLFDLDLLQMDRKILLTLTFLLYLTDQVSICTGLLLRFFTRQRIH